MQKFYFTFGSNHKFGDQSLRDCYTIITAEDAATASGIMRRVRERSWSMCYDNEEEAGVVKFGLRYVPWEVFTKNLTPTEADIFEDCEFEIRVTVKRRHSEDSITAAERLLLKDVYAAGLLPDPLRRGPSPQGGMPAIILSNLFNRIAFASKG